MDKVEDNNKPTPFYFDCLVDGGVNIQREDDYTEDQGLISRVLIDSIARYGLKDKMDIEDLEQQLWYYYTYAKRTLNSDKGQLSTHFMNICKFNLTEYFGKRLLMHLEYKDYILLRTIRKLELEVNDKGQYNTFEDIDIILNKKNTKKMRKRLLDLYNYEAPMALGDYNDIGNSVEDEVEIDNNIILRKWETFKKSMRRIEVIDDDMIVDFIDSRSFVFIEDKYGKVNLGRLKIILNRLVTINI